MAYVVRRPAGRWEIRESYVTPAGPRARTLATFRALSPAVIERAAASAQTPFDPIVIVQAAKRAGAPIEPAPGDALAATLVRALNRGAEVRTGLKRLLLAHLEPAGRPDDDVAEWLGCSLEERGAALVDLLGLADRLPKPRATRLTFPGFGPVR